MVKAINKKWTGEGGIGEILRIAMPLILSTGAHSIQMFVDRTFLMWYNSDAISASLQAGMASFTIISLFQGTVGYVNTFVAQYTGAERHHRVGHAIWQGIYLSIAASILILLLIPLAPKIFNFMGHEQQVRTFEITYFNIMCINALPGLTAVALSNFFTGRGKTKLVMKITLLITLINVVLDYCMIFGHFGFKEMGIAGAAWATVIATLVSVILFSSQFFQKKYREKYSTLRGAIPDPQLLFRIIRYGLPSGLEFMLVMISWTSFVAMSGKISNIALNATALTVQIESLSFMPMIGFGIAVSTLVGQRLGQNRPDIAQRTTYSAYTMSLMYMAILSLGYVTIPHIFIYPFAANADPSRIEIIQPVVFGLLIIIAIKNLFTSGSMVFSAAIRGAGDTRFVMISSVIIIWLTVTLPSIIAINVGTNIYILWTFATLYTITSFGVFLFRFKQGKWKNMRVIERTPAAIIADPGQHPDIDITTIGQDDNNNSD